VAKIVFSPKMPGPIMDRAREMVPDGFQLVVIEQGSAEFAGAMADAEYFMGFARLGLGPEFYRAAPKLKLVQLISAGYDRCDLEAARKARVPIANNGGANSVAVAEHTIMLMLAAARRMAWHHHNVVNGKWRVGDFASHPLYELEGKTLGIVGLGTIGKKVARRAAGFGLRIIYYDVVRLTEDAEDALGVRFVLLPELLRRSDIVTLHVPLNPQTHHLISTPELAMMKPGAILVNTCRGPVVDEQALHVALTGGRLAAAGLDVMVEEPPAANHPLFELENIVITPHMAGPTWENWPKAFRNAFDNIQRVARGQAPLWVVPELRG
jgi:phosphoglycerate dehydrogenase-like enzyme